MQTTGYRQVWRVLAAALAAIMVGGMLAGPLALAQDDEPEEEDAGHIQYAWAETLFPAVVRFYVGIGLPLEQVGSATLTVQQLDRVQESIPVGVGNVIFSDEVAVDFVYDWSLIERQPGLVPFEAVEFRWVVRANDGSESVYASDFFLQDERRGPWEAGGDLPLVLYWHSEQLAGRLIQQDVLAAYDQLTRRTGVAPLFRFAIYDPGVDLCQEIPSESEEAEEPELAVVSGVDGTGYPCSEALFEQAYANGGVTFLQRRTHGFAPLEDELVTAMVRQVYADQWAGQDVPAWFEEGLAALYRLRPGYGGFQMAQLAARDDALHDLAALQTFPPDDMIYREQLVWQAQAYLMMLYLTDRYGADAPFDLARDVAENGFDPAFAALTGGDQAAFWADWTRWLLSEDVEQAINWTPYVPVTPTPGP
ncbi:MAG: hypothetical protein GXY36_07325 [Chloroflexi bacterium]|nr:hypothetical protein [Chloroflexota bacterium]